METELDSKVQAFRDRMATERDALIAEADSVAEGATQTGPPTTRADVTPAQVLGFATAGEIKPILGRVPPPSGNLLDLLTAEEIEGLGAGNVPCQICGRPARNKRAALAHYGMAHGLRIQDPQHMSSREGAKERKARQRAGRGRPIGRPRNARAEELGRGPADGAAEVNTVFTEACENLQRIGAELKAFYDGLSRLRAANLALREGLIRSRDELQKAQGRRGR